MFDSNATPVEKMLQASQLKNSIKNEQIEASDAYKFFTDQEKQAI
jgi:hypothetical protein